eukprot:354192-Chlamydomonas_euryale.AAC.2
MARGCTRGRARYTAALPAQRRKERAAECLQLRRCRHAATAALISHHTGQMDRAPQQTAQPFPPLTALPLAWAASS